MDNVDFAVGDVHALDFPDDTFDVVHAHQVLQHVADPVQALREMRRVCRPGGYVAARDSDYAAFTWFPQLPELDEWLALYQRVARANGGEPDAGRRLLAWARAAGFTDVTATASTWCFADTRTAPGGAACGRTGSAARRSPTQALARGRRREPSCSGSPTAGGPGPPRPTAGCRSCTARSWPVPERRRVVAGGAEPPAWAGGPGIAPLPAVLELYLTKAPADQG